MITKLSSVEVEARVEPTISRTIAIEVGSDIILSEILLDDGDGYRTFHPLLIAIDDIDVAMPAVVAAGKHSIELKGEGFDGVGLLLEGADLHAIKSVDVSLTAAQMAERAQYFEGNGPPESNPLVTGKPNGSEYWDKVDRIRYKKSEGTWLQLAS